MVELVIKRQLSTVVIINYGFALTLYILSKFGYSYKKKEVCLELSCGSWIGRTKQRA